MSPLSIRFAMTKEATGNRRGPRFLRVPDKTKLQGRAACAAGMVAIAIRRRELSAAQPGYRIPEHIALSRRIDRTVMRISALWARVFAGQITEQDQRLVEAQAQHTALVQAYCTPAAA